MFFFYFVSIYLVNNNNLFFSAKTIVGEHRPHFFDTCLPDTNMNCTNGTYIFDFTCTNQNVSVIDKTDASRSFPSGHSSMSWFTALFCAVSILKLKKMYFCQYLLPETVKTLSLELKYRCWYIFSKPVLFKRNLD